MDCKAENEMRARMQCLESSLAAKERRVAELEAQLTATSPQGCAPYRPGGGCRCKCHQLSAKDCQTQTFATDFCAVESSGSVLDWIPPDGLSTADVVREAVAEASHQFSDYLYNQASGLYYSVSSGYYYDPVRKLFYEPHSRTYYSYDEAQGTYLFHSQLNEADLTQSKPQKSKKAKRLNSKAHRHKEKEEPKILEEGEIDSESSKSSSTATPLGSPRSTSDEENPERYPPSMRLIVKKSEKLATGSLLLVTFEGATVGRTEESGLRLTDNGISRTHAKIEYDTDRSCYLVYDLGSQNGTFVNLKRLTEPKVTSEEGREVNHGDWVTFGTTELVAHVHSGHNTCDQCEPGLLLQSRTERGAHVVLSKEEREEQRRDKLRRMKKKYALSDYAPDRPNQKYNDRAEHRRKTVGSSNPYEKDAEPSSVDKPVAEDSPGFKMLERLGWKKGESLGQGDSGRKEPVNAYEDGQIGRAGLGSRTAFRETCARGDLQIVIVPSVSSNSS